MLRPTGGTIVAAGFSERRPVGWSDCGERCFSTRREASTTMVCEAAVASWRPRLLDRLQHEGWTDNHKRVCRVYREENLQMRKRKRKRLARARCDPGRAAKRPNVEMEHGLRK